jgi:hypothetical protein
MFSVKTTEPPIVVRSMVTRLERDETGYREYPRGFVAKLIKAVFICGELRMQGERAGGAARLDRWLDRPYSEPGSVRVRAIDRRISDSDHH